MSFKTKALLALAASAAGCASSRDRLADRTFERPVGPVTSATELIAAGPAADIPDSESATQIADEILQTSATAEEAIVPPAPDDPTKPIPDAHVVTFGGATPQPIDLSTALALTGGRSPQVMFAQARIAESQAQLDRAETLWLPSIRFGLNYNKHEGALQDVEGNLIQTSRGAFYSGFGANAVGAGSPAVPGLMATFHTTDAVFAPRIAAHETGAQQSATRAALNDTLLNTALAYQNLLRTAQDLAIARQAQVRATELERVTGEFARTGQGLDSDFDRARAELALRNGDIHRAEEAFAVASARLAEQVRWDVGQQLVPLETAIAPVELSASLSDRQSLVSTALRNRPEVAENRYLVCAACDRLEREKNAPLLPSVLLGMSYGGFGAGLGGDIDGYSDRFDLDAVAFWEIRNLGFGEAAARNQACARVQQSRSREIATLDRVAREVVEAHSQVLSRRQQILSAEEAVTAAQSSYDRNIERIENGQGLPIEVLQSIQALANAQREYLRAITDYNSAQFTLHRALGWPIR
jgi:outer membrane protein TolC